jgi:hypothetical protein
LQPLKFFPVDLDLIFEHANLPLVPRLLHPLEPFELCLESRFHLHFLVVKLWHQRVLQQHLHCLRLQVIFQARQSALEVLEGGVELLRFLLLFFLNGLEKLRILRVYKNLLIFE